MATHYCGWVVFEAAMMFFLLFINLNVVSGSSLTTQKLLVQRRLKRLNKPAVKSIQSPDGDIIDCIHLSHQPAFDHPFFKNHTIRKAPAFPDGIFRIKESTMKKTEEIYQLWHFNGSCPEGTIPMRRIREGDFLRASSVKAYGKKKHRSFPLPGSTYPDMVNDNRHQHAIAYVEGDQYYGAKATINVWKPRIQEHNEFSLSQIWILGGSFGQNLNSIEAGWQVSPDLYGDYNTRLFSYWTSDAYQSTGCYNLLCSGFIQINHRIALGASIYPLSSSRSSQYDISLLVWKDPKEGNWWLRFGNDHVLGYWPSSIFSSLDDSASMVQWGGEIVNTKTKGEHTSTEMGSGKFPKEGFSQASYFRNIEIVDELNSLRPPDNVNTFSEQSDCYGIQNDENDDWGVYFYYGGPGRNSNCP